MQKTLSSCFLLLFCCFINTLKARNQPEIDELLEEMRQKFGEIITINDIQSLKYSNTFMICCIAGLVTYVFILRKEHHNQISDLKHELEAKGFLFVKQSTFGGGKLVHNANQFEVPVQNPKGWQSEKVLFKDILYIEANDKQCFCYVRCNENLNPKKLVMNEPYKILMTVFDNEFLEINRGTAVHKRYIQGEFSPDSRSYSLKLGFDANAIKVMSVSDRNIKKVKAAIRRHIHLT